MALSPRRYHPLRTVLAYWLVAFSVLPVVSSAKSQVPPPALEQAIDSSSLVLVARVSAVSEMRMIYGGKAERVIRTYEFEPVRPLKGVFVRDVLALTSDDLGNPLWAPRRGELRLLLLGRSGTGYRNVHRQQTLDESLPVLESVADPLVAAIERLIDVTQEPDRARRVELLLNELENAGGSGAIALLDSLRARAFLAAQQPGVVSVTQLLDDPSPAVKAAAARTLGAILEADYLQAPELGEPAVEALAGLLEASDPFVAARVAALAAIGAAHPEAARNLAARQLRSGVRRTTWAEQAALVQAVGRQQLEGRTGDIVALAEDLRLDAAPAFEHAVQAALIRLDPAQAARFIARRIEDKHLAGLEAAPEIELAGDLPPDEAVSLLSNLHVDRLSRRERIAFAAAGENIGDARLIPSLAALLNPDVRDVHWRAVDALRNIGTLEAAEALWPYLPQEANLGRKLEIAEFLARHGIDAGAAYALEHLSQPQLLEAAIAVLAAIGSPESTSTLRTIAASSNDVTWTGAAIRALGAMEDHELEPRLIDIVEDLRHPLAPYALVALGQVGEPAAAEVFRTAIRSRDDRIVAASVRGAAALMQRSGVDDESLRDDIAVLLASADASDDVRAAALDALETLEDPRLDAALAAAAVDAGLEGGTLLARIEELLERRQVPLAAALSVPQSLQTSQRL